MIVAALGPKMLELAGTVADGTVTWMTGPATLASHTVPMITAAAERAGRPAPRIVASLPICVTADADAARERAAKDFQVYGFLPSYRAMLDREGAAGPGRRRDRRRRGDRHQGARPARRRRRDRVRRVDLRQPRRASRNPRAAEVDALSAGPNAMADDPRSPLELLEALTVQEVEIAPDFRHLEIYTMRGLLTLLWHGPVDAHDVLVTCGGGMGSLLGPAEGLYHDLGVRSRRAASGRSASATASRTISRVACTTWPRPPTSPAGAARAGSS